MFRYVDCTILRGILKQRSGRSKLTKGQTWIRDVCPQQVHFHHWMCVNVSVLCTGGVNSPWSRACTAVQAGTAHSSRLQKQCSTQSTAHSHSTVKCNPSVTVMKSSPWRWPSRIETCRSVTIDDKSLFVHLLVISVFVHYNSTIFSSITSSNRSRADPSGRAI
jgi:uncharacterized Fe-S cluster protein YjdI